MNKVDSLSFRRIMGRFATGIAVVTSRTSELGNFGLTINSLTSVSLDPALLLFCLDKQAHLHAPLSHVDAFAINLLAQGQEQVSRHFADRTHNPVPGAMWGAEQQGCPVLTGTLGWILCRPYALHDGGDHTIFVGEVQALHSDAGDRQPLLYFQGRYREMADVGPIPGTLTSGARK